MNTPATPDPLMKVVKLDAAKVHTPPGNRKVTPESIADILPSIEKEGQLIPGIVYPMPDHHGEYGCADGNRRLLACRILGLTFLAYLLESVPTEEELIKLRVTVNHKRKDASPYELAKDIIRWIELKNATQKMAAEFFTMSEPALSKLLMKARNAIPEVVAAEQAGKIVEDIGRLIATLPKEMQAEALQHAIENDVKRDVFQRYVDGVKGGMKPKQPKSRPIIAVHDGATLKLPSTWPWSKIIDFVECVKEAAKRGMKIDGLSTVALPSLLQG